jgi:type IV pilus assembly protein PilQ
MKNAIIILFLVILLMPAVGFSQVSKQPPAKMSFDFIDADVKNVLRVFAEVAKRNMIIAEDVKGKVTIKLENVSYDEALDVVLRNNDLAKIEEENIVRIVTAKKLADDRERSTRERLEFLKEKEAKQKLEEEFVTETLYINYADVTEVEKMIRGETSTVSAEAASAIPGAAPAAAVVQRPRGLLSPNGVITLVKWNSALIVRDTKENVDRIVKLIREHDVPPQQVQIEARIVQASTSFSKDLGVQWTASYNNTIGGRTATTTATVSPGTASGAAGTLGILVGTAADSLQLNLELSALEKEGRGKIISNPKVITSDNRPAKITQGQQIPYLNNSSSTQGATVEFKDAVLELEVTPHVARDGSIRMTLKAKKDSADYSRATNGNTTNPPIDKKEAITELIVRDGETAVIGGIYEITQDDSDSGVPFLQRIPLLGWLFKRTLKTDSKTELLVFVTPTILKNLYTENKDR